jgi:hypothetical protein
MGSYKNFTQLVLVHEQKIESKKESLGLEHPWRVNSRACWSILEINIEELGC